MSRTNKRGIAAKKAQQKKQAARLKGARRFTYPKRKLDLEQAKELWVVWAYKNPKGATYNWFLNGRKVCRETRLKTDPDGYRLVGTPSGWKELMQVPLSGRVVTKLKNTGSQG